MTPARAEPPSPTPAPDRTELQALATRLRRGARKLVAAGTQARIDALVAWAESWTQRDPERDEAIAQIAAETGSSPQMISWGARTTCEVLTHDAAERWLLASLGPEHSLDDLDTWKVRAPELIAHIWASTLPTSGWLPVIGCLLAGSCVLIKASSRGRVAADAFARSLQTLSPLFANAVAVVQWPGGHDADAWLVDAVDALVVSGGTATIASYTSFAAQRKRGPIPVVPFGPGFSLALVPAIALDRGDLAEIAAGLAIDVAAYDQQGCLSPQAIWVEGKANARLLSSALASALDHLAEVLPRGEVPGSVAAALVQRVGTTHFTGEVFEARDAVVLLEPEVEPDNPNPLFRTIPVHVWDDGSFSLADALHDNFPQLRLHALGVAGSRDTRATFGPLARRFGASRICQPGTMQTPPFGWHHDQMAWLTRLLTFVDLE